MLRTNSGVARLCVAAYLAVAVAGPAAAQAAGDAARYWPEWRGPLHTGVAPAGDPPVEWSESSNVRWKVPLPGLGSATPVIWDDRLFVLTAVPTDERSGSGRGSSRGSPIGSCAGSRRPTCSSS